MVVVVSRIATTTGGDTATHQPPVPVVVKVVGRNRWCVVREELHARLDFLLLGDGEVILAELQEAGGRLLLTTTTSDNPPITTAH